MRRIDNIREDLERGYNLTICKRNGVCNGIIMFQPHEYLVSSCEEVAVRYVIEVMPGILDILNNERTVCELSYDRVSGKILSQIKEKKTEGPYCENCGYELVEDFETKNDDIFMGLIELDEKICGREIKSNNRKIKVKQGGE